MAGIPLKIYAGTGNGGTLVGSSSTTTNTTLGGFPSTTWTFVGGLGLIDNATYTAEVDAGSGVLSFQGLTSDTYPNGALTSNSSAFTGFDTVFQGNFSTTAVPFEFEPTGGLAILGGAWLLSKRLMKKKATKV